MTVALLGVGADSTNVSPIPPVYPDGTFEYIPIPESRGPAGTTETRTYGNSTLRHRDASMAEYLDHIRPTWNDDRTLTGERLAEWPLHHDPNFEALTYGETTSRGSYTKLLRDLEEGDVVAFYTGLCGDDASYTHRHIIGHFTVARVVDFQRLGGDRDVRFSDLSAEEQTGLIERHGENAHAKRFAASGEIAANDGLVIVDGKAPGGLLETAVRISRHGGGGHHYLTDTFQRTLSPAPSGNPERNAYLGGIKQAHALDVSPERFREFVA